jgi:hypothetical protein
MPLDLEAIRLDCQTRENPPAGLGVDRGAYLAGLDSHLADKVPALLAELATVCGMLIDAAAVEGKLRAELDSARAIAADLLAEVRRVKETAARAWYIMYFHALRCPLNPMTNYSGMEEHLAMYRGVLDELKALGLPEMEWRDFEYQVKRAALERKQP